MRIAFTAALLLSASPALAQPMDRGMDHTGHGDAHAGHAMPDQPPPPPTPPPASTPADPHAGHTMPMPKRAPEPAVPPVSDPHAGHGMTMQGEAMPGETKVPPGPPPPEALSGPAHAADTVYPATDMAAARTGMAREMGAMTIATFQLDRLEAQSGKGADTWLWDADVSHGGDIDKLWLKSEGHGAFGGAVEEAELQALWSHAIGPWFDLQAGVRQQWRKGPDRTHLAIGVQGLAPYFFEVDAAAFLSTKGEVTARIEAEYDQRLTQRLILQPRVEATLSAQDIPELGMGSGVTSLQAGLRLRYEIVREFAPYVGVEWQRDLGRTARFTRAVGDDPSRTALVAGVRFWF